MKRGTVFFALFVAITLLIALAVQQSTQAQRQDRPGAGRGPRGSFMITRAANLESYWAHLCLEMKITDEAMIKGRGIFVKAMEERAKVIKDVEAAGDDQEAMDTATSKASKIRTDVLAKLKDLLSSKEMEEFTKWEESQRQQRQRMRTPPGAPGN